MGHSFNGLGLEQLLGDVRHLALELQRHEHRLHALSEAIKSSRGIGPTSADVLSAILHACVTARDHRQLAESALRRVIGDPASGPGAEERRPLVLIVDDDEDIRDLAATTIEVAGFRALTAANGLEGLIAAQYAQPSVVLMDIAMPLLDGLETARLLKAGPATRHLRVIAHTATPSLYASSQPPLFVGVLPKPSPPDLLVAMVRRSAAGPAQPGSAVTSGPP